jgi:hypothetical protein
VASINFDTMDISVKTKIQDKQVNVVSTSFELLLNIVCENLNKCIQCEDKNLGEIDLNFFWTIINITYLLVDKFWSISFQ